MTMSKPSLVIMIVFIYISVFTGCETPPIEPELREEIVPVQTAPVTQETFVQTLELSGRSRSWSDYPVLSPSPLRVDKVFVELGEEVQKGQRLLTFDGEDAHVRLEEAREQLEAVEQAMEEMDRTVHQVEQPSEETIHNALQRMERANAIIDGAHTGAVTMLDLLQATTELQLLQNQMQIHILQQQQMMQMQPLAMQQHLQQARLQVQMAEEAVQQLTVEAPFDGVITALNVAEQGMARPNHPILQLSQLDRLIVDVQVSGATITQLRKDQKAHVYFEGIDEPIEAAIDAISPSPLADQPFFQTKIYIDNDEGLFPGQFVKVLVETEVIEDALLVPVEALFYQQGMPHVYKVQNNTAVLQQVVVGERSSGYYHLIEGLQNNDQVVTLGLERLTDGRKVYIHEAGDTH